MRNRLSLLLLSSLATLLIASPAFASFHLMKIEEAIGGVGGDTGQQAIQLRMRFPGQNLVGSNQARLIAHDAAGLNPVTLIVFPSDVANSAQGARILVVSPAFASAHPGIPGDFTMTNLIPSSYLPAGRLTFEDSVGTILWSLAWGGAGYTGSNLGSTTNDVDGNFGPPFGSALPSSTNRALLFTTSDPTGGAPSTTNVADYALTAGAAVFTNNAGTSGTLPPPQADLSITKTDGQASAVPGAPITYTIVVSNAGPSGVTAATVADTPPAAITGASWTCSGTLGGTCTPVGAGSIDDTVNLPSGATVTYFLTGTISASATGSLSNTATVTAPNGVTDPDPANNSATDIDNLPGVDFFTVAPCRVVDTRGGAPIGGPALQGQETRVFTVAGLCGISATAKAVSINVTVALSTSAGNVRLFPAGDALPTISTINYTAGQTRANNAIIKLNSSGAMSAFAGQPAGTTVHVIIDVNGYFE
jgi:uncharacterized repeat protein (TIGR01451 family)